MADGKTEHGRRLQTGIEPDGDSLIGQDSSSQLCKITGMNPAVTTDGAGWMSVILQQIGGQAARCLHDGKNIHAVGSGTEHAS